MIGTETTGCPIVSNVPSAGFSSQHTFLTTGRQTFLTYGLGDVAVYVRLLFEIQIKTREVESREDIRVFVFFFKCKKMRLQTLDSDI